MKFGRSPALFALAVATACFTISTHGQVDEHDRFANPLPESGRWFTNDGSRTGFFIEVQDGVLAGLYVGGDADGDNAWLSFSGRLQPIDRWEDPEGGWILETDLLRFSGIGCIIDCAGGDPAQSTYEDVGDIRIDFLGRGLARVWIDDQPVREIAPIFFGVDRVEVHPQAPPLFLPDFAGKWVVAKANDQDFPDRYLDVAIIEIAERTVEHLELPADPDPDTQNVRYVNPIIDDPDGIFPTDARIECTTFVDSSRRPSCFVLYRLGPMAQFAIPFDSITDSRLTVLETTDVIPPTVQYRLIKLNHD